MKQAQEALNKILETKIILAPLLKIEDRILHSETFSSLNDASDIPHAISALVYTCEAIVAYNDHFKATSDVMPYLAPEEVILNPEKYLNRLISPNYEQKDPKDIPDVPPELRQKVLERDGYKCVMCGSAKYLQIDHIKPFSKGGNTVFENLQTLCRKCKLKKGILIGRTFKSR